MQRIEDKPFTRCFFPLFLYLHLQLIKTGRTEESSVEECVPFMVYKEYSVHHISETGSSITAHSPHITLSL